MRILISRKHKWEMLALAAITPLLIWACVFAIDADSIKYVDAETGEEVMYIEAGKNVQFQFSGRIEQSNGGTDEKFIVGFLAPSSWNASEAKVTYTENYYEPGANKPMTYQPTCGTKGTWDEVLKAAFGVGTNVLSDMTWFIFESNEVYSPPAGQTFQYTVTIECNVGTNNLRFKPSFFINHSSDNFSGDAERYGMAEGECFEVVEGNGATIDYCSFHYYSVTPLLSLQDDYVTFTFVGDTNTNELSDCDEIYFVATAHTADGNTYSGEKLLMLQQSGNSSRFDATIWPGGYFNVPEGEIITYIDYYFTNADGTLVVNQSDDERDNAGEEPENEDEPFSFELRCD